MSGKDKRVPLRKATDDEVRDWMKGVRGRPDDLVDLAAAVGFVPEKDSKIKVDPAILRIADAPPNDILGFIDWFEADYGKNHRPRSVVIMGGILKNFRKYVGSTTISMVDQVTPGLVEGFFDWRLQQVHPVLKIQVKPTTIVNELTLLSGLFTTAVDHNKMIVNPVKPVAKKLHKAYPRPAVLKYLDPDQRHKFMVDLEAAEKSGSIPSRYADAGRVIISTGLRRTAAINLEWGWIGANWVITVPPEYDKLKIGYTTVVADVGQEVLTRLHLESTTDKVFPDVKGDSLLHHLRKLGTFPHALRHTYATALVDREVPIQIIGSLLGQTNLKTTQHYARVREQAKLNAVARLSLSI